MDVLPEPSSVQMVAKGVISAPVPAVVGIKTRVIVRVSKAILDPVPTSASSLSVLMAMLNILAVSNALPPPNAKITSGIKSPRFDLCRLMSIQVGFGLTNTT